MQVRRGLRQLSGGQRPRIALARVIRVPEAGRHPALLARGLHAAVRTRRAGDAIAAGLAEGVAWAC